MSDPSTLTQTAKVDLLETVWKVPKVRTRGLQRGLNRNVSASLASVYRSDPLPGRYSNYFPDSLSTLDFSQLRAEGVGMLLTHPLKERPAIDAPIPCSLIFLAKKVAAL